MTGPITDTNWALNAPVCVCVCVCVSQVIACSLQILMNAAVLMNLNKMMTILHMHVPVSYRLYECRHGCLYIHEQHVHLHNIYTYTYTYTHTNMYLFTNTHLHATEIFLP
jgi:hypothetical protein